MEVSIGKVCGYGKKEYLGCVDVEILAMEEKECVLKNLSIVQPFAGKKHGFYTLPQIGDMVLVMFLSSTLKRAVVLGSLHRSNDDFYKLLKSENEDLYWITPQENKIHFHEKKDKAFLEIRMKHGSGMLFEDEKDEITCFTKDKKNMLHLKGKDKSIEIQADSKVQIVCGKSKWTLDKSGNIKIEAVKFQVDAQEIELKSKNKIKMDALQLQLDGKTKAALNSNGIVEVKAKGTAKISGAQVSLK